MIVDNFKLIEDKLTFNNPDEFYFVQVLMRGKDGNTQPGINGNNKNRQIAFYCITSKEKLEEKKDEIITLCKTKNARCYIHPTKRSFKEVAVKALVLTADIIEKENYMGMKGVYSTACGQSFITKDKKFVVDVDRNGNENDESINRRATEMVMFMNTECEPLGYEKLIYTVPTKNGLHLITMPFNTAKFGEKYPTVDIHKNNPTLLYYNNTYDGTPICNDINAIFEELTYRYNYKQDEVVRVKVELNNGITTQSSLGFDPYEGVIIFKYADGKEIDQSCIMRVWTMQDGQQIILWERK